MTAPTTILDDLADAWEREKADGAQLVDPALGDLSAGELADLAWRMASDFDRDLAALQANIRLRERPFSIEWPAIARWRDGVLRDARRQPRHVVAAALEMTALECTLAGYEELAQRARAQAEAVMLPQRAYAT